MKHIKYNGQDQYVASISIDVDRIKQLYTKKLELLHANNANETILINRIVWTYQHKGISYPIDTGSLRIYYQGSGANIFTNNMLSSLNSKIFNEIVEPQVLPLSDVVGQNISLSGTVLDPTVGNGTLHLLIYYDMYVL